MTVVFIKDFVKARSGTAQSRLAPAPTPSTKREVPVRTEHGGAWYHQAAIVDADKTIPHRD